MIGWVYYVSVLQRHQLRRRDNSCRPDRPEPPSGGAETLMALRLSGLHFYTVTAHAKARPSGWASSLSDAAVYGGRPAHSPTGPLRATFKSLPGRLSSSESAHRRTTDKTKAVFRQGPLRLFDAGSSYTLAWGDYTTIGATAFPLLSSAWGQGGTTALNCRPANLVLCTRILYRISGVACARKLDAPLLPTCSPFR
ncbi:hypothetical protein KCP73_19385 [Salmonella enterica subsp. enterica]|nr:hypothetical protein KCP73_19385 [Salmonella enterica subsp. enterica]